VRSRTKSDFVFLLSFYQSPHPLFQVLQIFENLELSEQAITIANHAIGKAGRNDMNLVSKLS